MFWNVSFGRAIYTQVVFQFQILNLCSEIYFLRGQFIQIVFQFQILNLYSEMCFLREQFIPNLWLLTSLAAALYFRGCWIIWLLNNMAADLYFLSKFSPQVKTLAILTCINTNLRCIKDYGLLWIKQTDGPGLCFEDQYEALQISKSNCWLPEKPW